MRFAETVKRVAAGEGLPRLLAHPLVRVLLVVLIVVVPGSLTTAAVAATVWRLALVWRRPSRIAAPPAVPRLARI